VAKAEVIVLHDDYYHDEAITFGALPPYSQGAGCILRGKEEQRLLTPPPPLPYMRCTTAGLADGVAG
jgi:hypothetical protein